MPTPLDNNGLEDLTARTALRRELFERQAIGLTQQVPELAPEDIAAALYRLLCTAYQDGGQDMYAAIDKRLKPLWRLTGLEP